MEYTKNLNLKKPTINEYYNVTEQENANMDIIDEAVGKLNNDVGTEELTTEAQDCKGAINELNKKSIGNVEAISGTTQIYNMSRIEKKNGVAFGSFTLKALVALSSGDNIASIPDEFKLATGGAFFTKIYDTNGKDLGSAWFTTTGKVQYYANDGTTKIPVNSVLYISFIYVT